MVVCVAVGGAVVTSIGAIFVGAVAGETCAREGRSGSVAGGAGGGAGTRESADGACTCARGIVAAA